MRAFWRVALFILLYAVFLVLAGLCLRGALLGLHVHLTLGVVTSGLVGGYEVFLLIPALAATWVLAVLEGTNFSAYGFAGVRRLAPFLAGFGAGLAAITVLLALLLSTGAAHAAGGGQGGAAWRFGGGAAWRFGGGAAWGLGAAWAGASCLTGLNEEYLFRGYLLAALARGIGFWPAALVTSLAFAALHAANGGETPLGLLAVFGFGLVLCLAVRRTGALFWPIGAHAAWDYGENFLFGTHDSGTAMAGSLLSTTPAGPAWLSGGSAGPEGSVLCLAVLAALALLIHRGTLDKYSRHAHHRDG